MKRKLTALILSALLACCPLALCADAQTTGEALGFSLLEQLYLQGENPLISPWGLAQALSMAAEGADGETRQELLSLLQTQAPAPLNVSAQGVTTAAAALFDDSLILLDSYVQALQAYGAPCLEGLSMEAVNDWAREHTGGRIDPLLTQPLPDTARLALLTAIALEADWAQPFDAANTYEQPFYTAQGAVNASFLHCTGQMEYGLAQDMQLLRLPYAGEELACYLILPPEEGMEQALSLLKTQGYQLFQDLEPAQVSLALPKLSLDSGLDLSGHLAALGLSLANSNDADFSGMDGDDGLKLGPVVQRTRLDLDEAGTQAASATAAVMVTKSALPPQDAVNMTLDRPFILLVREEASGQTLFAACVLTPQSAADQSARQDGLQTASEQAQEANQE